MYVITVEKNLRAGLLMQTFVATSAIYMTGSGEKKI